MPFCSVLFRAQIAGIIDSLVTGSLIAFEVRPHVYYVHTTIGHAVGIRQGDEIAPNSVDVLQSGNDPE